MPSNAALDALGHAVSGSIGTGISTAVVFPLDLVTTRLKAQRQRQRQLDSADQYDGVIDGLRTVVSRDGGFAALYNGLGPSVGKSLVDSFLFFGFYTYLRQTIRQSSVVRELATGALAGACSRVVTTPISNVVTRMQMKSDTESVREALVELKRQGGGVAGLWSGYSATLILTMSPSITFFVNRRLARRIIPALEEEDIPVAWIAFLLAAFSKSAATVLTYPFQTGRTRLQIPNDVEDSADTEKGKNAAYREHGPRSLLARLFEIFDKTVFGIIIRIINKEGVRALFDGLQGELLKGFLSHGLTMVTKGSLHRLVIRLWFLSQPYLRRRIREKR
ncbi:hypothetical protein E4U31_006580 [Claviceps sp. LM219 group G6]|nr:hypothetical protein E4U15_000334 [Claviceps sp. LM218 group G6]KAG6109752.1 hypothetical protein E4U31_006580 [Claviceps sp. LM219 group G6]